MAIQPLEFEILTNEKVLRGTFNSPKYTGLLAGGFQLGFYPGVKYTLDKNGLLLGRTLYSSNVAPAADHEELSFHTDPHNRKGW